MIYNPRGRYLVLATYVESGNLTWWYSARIGIWEKGQKTYKSGTNTKVYIVDVIDTIEHLEAEAHQIKMFTLEISERVIREDSIFTVEQLAENIKNNMFCNTMSSAFKVWKSRGLTEEIKEVKEFMKYLKGLERR